MKNLLIILSLAIFSSMTMVHTESLNNNTEVAVSSKTDPPHTTHQFRYETVDCNAFPPDSTFPRIKTFVPDSTLTASMPLLKPDPVDPGIFEPGECFYQSAQN